MIDDNLIELDQLSMSFSSSSIGSRNLARVVSNFNKKNVAHIKNKTVWALKGVSLQIKRGETMGLVGESGCGKSTLGRCIVRLYQPASGSIRFQGENITTYQGKKLRDLRKLFQMVFQDPYSSLNPKMAVKDLLEEPLIVHQLGSSVQRSQRVSELLNLVGLSQTALHRYSHQFSGGQRQRIAIARALAVRPILIICDEVTSALDVSVQAQIVNLLIQLQDELKLTYLFISHDLNVVSSISHRIAVMYCGRIIELGPAQKVYQSPEHPYTKALISAIPQMDPDLRKNRMQLKGQPPSLFRPPAGCSFHPRCPLTEPQCMVAVPPLIDVDRQKNHQAACILVGP